MKLQKYLSVCVAMALGLTPPMASWSASAVAGSTEVTQLTSWVQNFKNFTDQINNLRSQLQTLQTMQKQLASVTGLVRDAQAMIDTIKEVQGMKNDIQNAFGALDSIRSFADQRYQEIGSYKSIFGNAKTVQDYFIESARANARDHKMNQVLRDQEVAAIKRLEASGQSIQQHASKISGAEGVNQSVALLNTQINNLAAMSADINKIQAVRSLKQTEADDMATAQRERMAKEGADTNAKAISDMQRQIQILGRN